LSANATIAVPSSMMMTYVVSAPKPVYPIFRHAPVDTIVDVQTTISKEGKVISARALSGALDVRGAAAQAVQTWRFRPFTLDGTPVAVVTTFKFVFKAR
jgi:protein TonB